MSLQIGHYYSMQVKKHGTRQITWTPSSTLDMNLYTNSVTRYGVGTLAAWSGYAASSIPNDTTKFGIDGEFLENIADLNGGAPTGGTLPQVISVSFTTPGVLTEVYFFGNLTAPIQPVVGQAFVIPAGSFSLDII